MDGNIKSKPPLYTGDDNLSIHDESIHDESAVAKPGSTTSNWTGFLIALLSIATLLFILLFIGLGIWFFLFLAVPDDELVVINVNVTLDRQYVSDYLNASTFQYRELETEFITAMDDIIGNNEIYSDFYAATTISKIRPGSVEIVSWMLFLNSIRDSFNINTELRQSLQDTLTDVIEANDGRLPGIEGLVLEFVVSNPIDPDDRPITPTREPTSPPDGPDNGCYGFLCNSGECFPSDWECDFEEDCLDGSDEDQCQDCSQVGFTCDSGECIPADWECDYEDDCSDGSDEHRQCPDCYDVGYLCNSGQCIRSDWECDFEPDCEDGSDEHVECPAPPPCNGYRCDYAFQFCVDESLVCDGNVDCPYGSDEESCQDECFGFQCGSGECFPADFECDFEADCEDESDEHGECPACSDTGFTCDNGDCIPSDWVCDTVEECSDGSDEHSRCPNCYQVGFICDNGECVPADWECDYEPDCSDGSDEHYQCPEPELCDANYYRCEYAPIFCIPESLLCNGEYDCPNEDDEEYCPDDCGESRVFLGPGESYELTSLNYPFQYPNDLFCQWSFSAPQGRHLLLQFSQFSLESEFDYLSINLEGQQDFDEDYTLSYTGSDLPPDLLSRGSDVFIAMVTDESTTDYGFVLQITETDGEDAFVCEDDQPVPSGSVCDGYQDCEDNSDEAPCQCGDIGPDIYLDDTNDLVQLSSVNFPYEYTDSLDCFWTVRASLGYRVFLRFKAFSLEYGGDYLKIAGTEGFDPLVSYTGYLMPPEIESPSDFLYIWFETDFAVGDSGFLLSISQIQPLDRQKCDNELELYPENGGLCDGTQHCHDNSDEPEGCECGQDNYLVVPGSEAITLYSTNYPLDYQDNTRCIYNVYTTAGNRLLVKVLQMDLEDGFDFVYIEAGETLETVLSYTGKLRADRAALDVVSSDNNVGIYFETDESFTDSGFVIQIVSVPSDFNDDRLFCNNGVQLVPEEFICDAIYDCHDKSDEEDCVDIFNTDICGTRPALDKLRIINGEEADEGEFPWLGLVQYGDAGLTCGAALVDEYWAVTAAHCVVGSSINDVDEISVVFGDVSYEPESPNRQEIKSAFYIVYPGYPTLTTDTGTTIGGDIALIRLETPVKFTEYVRPICITASSDEPNDYQQCRIAGWGLANVGGGTNQTIPDYLQAASIPLLQIEDCAAQWSVPPSTSESESSSSSSTFTSYFDYESDFGFSPDIWFDEANILCAGNGVFVNDPEDVIDVCFGDSGTPLVCLGDNNVWHFVGIVSNGPATCMSTERTGIFERVSAYREYIKDTVSTVEACLSSDDTTCIDSIPCAGGSRCNLPPCNLICSSTKQCLTSDLVCNGYEDCPDGVDELVCLTDCGRSDIYLSNEDDTYVLTSQNYPDNYLDRTTCEWTITAPSGSRIRAVFDAFEIEQGFDFVYVSDEPLGLLDGELPNYRLTGYNASSFLSPSNRLFVGMRTDDTDNLGGFALTLSIFRDNEDTLTFCGDDFQVRPQSSECDGFSDCQDNTDEAPCDCPDGSIEMPIPPDSPLLLETDRYSYTYQNSYECTYIVTAPQGSHIYVELVKFQLDVETDSLSISSLRADEGVFTYRGGGINAAGGQATLYFQTNEISVRWNTDAFNNQGYVQLEIRETSGDDCVFSTNPNCVDRPGCTDKCYHDFCASGVEVYPLIWFCDGTADCSDQTDERDMCECGETDVFLSPDNTVELSSPISSLYPPAYPPSSNCQWIITTLPGNVLFAHFNSFDIEDARQYPLYDDVVFGDYLYVGTGTSPQRSKLIRYTGSDTPLDIETPGSSLVFTFMTDDSVAYDGFSVIIFSRKLSALSKCDNSLEILPVYLRCNDVPDCNGVPTDELGCSQR